MYDASGHYISVMKKKVRHTFFADSKHYRAYMGWINKLRPLGVTKSIYDAFIEEINELIE